MKIKYKLFFSSLLIVAVFLIAGYSINTNVAYMGMAHDELAKAVKVDDDAKEYLAGARALQVGVYLSVHGSKDMGEQLMKEGTDKMSNSRNDLRKLLSDPAMLTSLSDAERLEEKVVEASNSVINNIDNKPLTEQNLNTLLGRVQALELKLKDLEENAEKNMDIAMADTQKRSQNTIESTYLGTIGALLVSLVLSFAIASLLTKPIATLTDIANRVSKGDIEAKVTVASKDEIGDLAESFKRMVNAFRIMDALSKEK